MNRWEWGQIIGGGNTIFETHHFMALKLFNEWLTANVKQIAIKLIH